MVSKLHYWGSTVWTPVITLFNPVFNTFSMEVVALVAMKLSNHIIGLVINQTNYTGGFMLKHLRVVLGSREA
jgi:hypothetical protein